MNYLEEAKTQYGRGRIALWGARRHYQAATAAALIAIADLGANDIGTKGYLEAVGPLIEQMAQASTRAVGGAAPVGFTPGKAANHDDPTSEPQEA